MPPSTSTLYFEVSGRTAYVLYTYQVSFVSKTIGSPFSILSMLWNLAPCPSRCAASEKLPFSSEVGSVAFTGSV